MLKKIFLIVLVAIMITMSPVNAESNDLPDPGMLPTSNFYFLKTWGENIGTFFTFREEAKAERMLKLSEKRLAEIEALTELGETEKAERIMNRYEQHIEKALQRAQRVREKGIDNDELLIKISEATFRHQNVLGDVYERVPERARPMIEKAMERGMKGHEKAVENVSSEEARERVMINVEEQMQEMEQRKERLEESGVKVPKMPSREEVQKNFYEIELPAGIPDEINLPVEIPVDIDLPQMPRRGR